MIEHLARVTWSEQCVATGLPEVAETIDPAWLGSHSTDVAGWSLICRFDPSPRAQGNPTKALVRFLAHDAPHEVLRPGMRLQMFERGTGRYAEVEILE